MCYSKIWYCKKNIGLLGLLFFSRITAVNHSQAASYPCILVLNSRLVDELTRWRENCVYKVLLFLMTRRCQRSHPFSDTKVNKAEYTATPVACRWAGAVFEVTWSLGQEQQGHRLQQFAQGQYAVSDTRCPAWNKRQGSGPEGDEVL